MNEPGILVAAYLTDLIIGDPQRIPHPVQGIGWCIEKGELILRRGQGGAERSVRESGERFAGCVLALFISGLTFAFFSVVSMILKLPLHGLSLYVSVLIFIYLVSTTVATRELIDAGQEVVSAISSGNIEAAREKLGMIVGRDTHTLDSRSILRATVETLSENSSDGVIAPLFYFALGGLPLAMTYKAINTLDSMVGYKNEKYLHFGWASARLDDIINFVPARLTGGIIVIASCIVGVVQCIVCSCSNPVCTDQGQHGKSGGYRISGMSAFKIMLRDGGRHASPNSGIPEAAMAGALGVKLGGASAYGGVEYQKPFIGDEEMNSEAFYIRASKMALTITRITSILGLFAALLILHVRTSLWN